MLGSNIDENFEISTSALVVPHLSGNLPSKIIDPNTLSNMSEIPLAEPRFYESSKIDLLIRGDLLSFIMLLGIRQNICGSMIAQETVFGWFLTGPIPTQTVSTFSSFVSHPCEISIDNQISRFSEVEEIPKKTFRSFSDQFCEDLYLKTTKRRDDGRYIVSLPFKEEFTEGKKLDFCETLTLKGNMMASLKNICT